MTALLVAMLLPLSGGCLPAFLTINEEDTAERRAFKSEWRAMNCLDGEWVPDSRHPGELYYRCHMPEWRLKRALQ